MLYEIGERLHVDSRNLSHNPIEGNVKFVEYLMEDEDDMIPYRVEYIYLDDEGDKHLYDDWIHEDDILGYAKKIFIGGE